MSSIKSVLLWISAAMLIVGLGLFSTVTADQHIKASPAAASPASQSQPAVQPAAPAGDLQCGAEATDATEMSLPQAAPAAVGAACPSGTAFTCCSCGGCGCRPQHISPANWCAC